MDGCSTAPASSPRHPLEPFGGGTSTRGASDVQAVVEVANRMGAPILSRGGGTSLTSQTVNHAGLIDEPAVLSGVLMPAPFDALRHGGDDNRTVAVAVPGHAPVVTGEDLGEQARDTFVAVRERIDFTSRGRRGLSESCEASSLPCSSTGASSSHATRARAGMESGSHVVPAVW